MVCKAFRAMRSGKCKASSARRRARLTLSRRRSAAEGKVAIRARARARASANGARASANGAMKPLYRGAATRVSRRANGASARLGVRLKARCTGRAQRAMLKVLRFARRATLDAHFSLQKCNAVAPTGVAVAPNSRLLLHLHTCSAFVPLNGRIARIQFGNDRARSFEA